MLEYVPIPAIIIGSLVYAWWRRAYLTQVMVISNFLIFLYMFVLIWQNNLASFRLLSTYAFVPARFGQVEYLPSIFTSMFMHIEPLHIIGNVLFLYLLGLPLEERIGTKNWGIIYLASGVAGTMMYYLFQSDSSIYLLGASGAIFGLGGALLILYPRDRVPMFIGPIFSSQAPVWLAVGTMFVVETLLVFMAVDDGTAHVAHVGGLICGIFLAPALAKGAGTAKEKSGNLDFQLLKQMALKPEDALMVEKIEKETEPDVRDAWLEFYLKNAARCPKCRRKLGSSDDTIKCECGQSWKVRG